MPAPRILICPLDWGLGHAARCVPLIHALRSAGAQPVIAADKGPLELLQKEFPQGEFIRFPGVSVTYPTGGGTLFWSMLRQSPALLKGIRQETRFVEKMVKELHIQGVISDNRFGAYSERVPSVYITHQIHIQTGNGFTDALARMQHARYMRKFGQVWIPDVAGAENLSGKLSHGKHLPKHAEYIGPLSRLYPSEPAEKIYDAALVLSGPEPQRTLLEEKFMRQIEAFPNEKFVLVRGKNEPLGITLPNLTQIPLATHSRIQEIYSQTQHLICRSGYTSLMEMASIGRSAWLVPTPGQTEQEYLARYLNGKYGFVHIRQERLELAQVLEHEIQPFTPFSMVTEMHRAAVENFLSGLK